MKNKFLIILFLLSGLFLFSEGQKEKPVEPTPIETQIDNSAKPLPIPREIAAPLTRDEITERIMLLETMEDMILFLDELEKQMDGLSEDIKKERAEDIAAVKLLLKEERENLIAHFEEELEKRDKEILTWKILGGVTIVIGIGGLIAGLVAALAN